MQENWLSRLDDAIGHLPPQPPDSDVRSETAKVVVRHFFGMWRAFKIEMNVEFRMTPWQWEMIEYLGDGEWRFRRFPFHRLQSISLAHGEPVPLLEARIATGGSDDVEFYMMVPAHRRSGMTTARQCLLDSTSYEGAEEALRSFLPVLMERWAAAITLDDERIVIDWALDRDGGRIPSPP